MPVKGAAKTAQVVAKVRRKKGRLTAEQAAILSLNDSMTTLKRRLMDAKKAAQMGHDIARTMRDVSDDPLVKASMDFEMDRIKDLAGL